MPEQEKLARQQPQPVEGLGADVFPGAGKVKVRLAGGFLDARLVGHIDQLVPLPARPQVQGVIVGGVVADVEIDAAVVGDENRVVADGVVVQGHWRDHQQGAQQKDGGAALAATAPAPADPRRGGQDKAQDRGHCQGGQPEEQTGGQEGAAARMAQGAQQQYQPRQIQKSGHRSGQEFATVLLAGRR